ncbi:MAG: hypothetical protein ABIE68_00480 [bacterium]
MDNKKKKLWIAVSTCMVVIFVVWITLLRPLDPLHKDKEIDPTLKNVTGQVQKGFDELGNLVNNIDGLKEDIKNSVDLEEDVQQIDEEQKTNFPKLPEAPFKEEQDGSVDSPKDGSTNSSQEDLTE